MHQHIAERIGLERACKKTGIVKKNHIYHTMAGRKKQREPGLSNLAVA